jgi:ribosome-associated protein
MIRITPEIAIDEDAIQVSFTRSSGPGGQRVNRAATAVQLRFDVAGASLPEDVRQRLTDLAGNRINKEGELIIEASSHRSQARNRQEALNRLVDLIRQAAKKPKPRRETRRTAASERRRLENKRRRSEKKRRRRFTPPPDAL